MRQFMEFIVVELMTKLGLVHLTITEAAHICVGTKDGKAISVNRMDVTFSLHLNDYGNGFELSKEGNGWANLYHALYARKVSDREDISHSAKEKIAAVMIAAVNEWAKTNKEVLQKGQVRYVNNQIMSKEEEVAKHEAALAKLRSEIESLEDSLL